MLLIHESAASRQWRSSWQNINTFESVELWTLRRYLEASLVRVDAGFIFSMCVCRASVHMYPQVAIQGFPPSPRRVHISSAAFLDKISQQTARPNR